MKKSLIALAALGAFAGAASAQSSVTLFGVVDVNARNVDNSSGGSVRSLSQDGNASSRLGFRGVEDLGGGLRGGFWLEAGMAPSSGAIGNAGQLGAGETNGSLFFNRRSTVSLLGSFGEVRLGRDYTPDFWNHTVFDPFGTNGVGSSVNTFGSNGSGATTVVRANNSIGYFLPAMGGIYGQAMIAAGEGATGNKHMGFRLGYGAGPVNVAFAYGKTEATSTVDWTRWNLGGSFNAGFATLMAQYVKSEVSGGANNGFGTTLWLLGANVPVGGGTLKFSYVDSDGTGGANATNDAKQYAVGYVYDLSKRTAIYGHLARIDNSGSARYAIGGGTALPAAGQTSTGYEIGVRHSF